jgi:TonB family protein
VARALNRPLAFAAASSLALHALLLAFAAPALKESPAQAFPTAMDIVVQVVEQAAAPVPQAEDSIKPAALKRQVPKARAGTTIAEPVALQPAPAAAAVESPQQETVTQVASVALLQPGVDATTIAQYRQMLITSAARHKLYPSVAVDNDWHGDVVVRLSIAAGAVTEASVARSSGYGLLDEQALAMFRNAAANVPVPAALRGQEFNLEVRAVYSLKD